MKKTLLLVLSAIVFSPNVRAEDFALRVAIVGYEVAEDGPGTQRRPPVNLRKLFPGDGGGQDGAGDRKAEILRSIETQIIPGEKFSASSKNAAEILELRGSSTRDNESKLRIKLYYKYSKITAEAMEAIRSAKGDASKLQRIMKLLTGSSTETSIVLKPGDSHDLGGISFVTEGAKKFSAYRIVVSLRDRDMDGRKSAEASEEPKPR